MQYQIKKLSIQGPEKAEISRSSNILENTDFLKILTQIIAILIILIAIKIIFFRRKKNRRKRRQK